MSYTELFFGTLLLLQVFSCQLAVEPNVSHADFSNDPTYPAFNQELIIDILGDSVAGYAFVANDSTLKETVILIQGYPGNDNNFDLAQALRRNGLNVIHFNHRGAWGSQGTYLYSNCLLDVDEIIAHISKSDVAKKLRVDTDRINLIGRSFGGGIALIQGSVNASIKKIVAISSVNYGYVMEKYDGLDQLTSFKNYMKKQVMIDTDIDVFLQEMLDEKYKFDVLSYRNQMKNKKVLIIEDSNKNDPWIDKLPHVDVLKMESGHNFIDRRIEMIDQIVSWIKSV